MSAWQFSSACAQNGPGIPLAEPAFPSVHHAVALLDKSARREPRLHVPVVDYGVNLLLLSLMSLFNLRYLTRRPELCHEGLTPSRVADSYRRILLAATDSPGSKLAEPKRGRNDHGRKSPMHRGSKGLFEETAVLYSQSHGGDGTEHSLGSTKKLKLA